LIQSETKSRIILTFVCCLVTYGALALRLFSIQVSGDSKLKNNPHLRRFVLHRARGPILDRNGNRLAFSVSAVGVNVDARQVPDPGQAASQLSSLLGIPPEELAPKLRSGRGYVKLADRVDPEVAAQIRKLRIPGIGYEQEYRRFFPNGSMLSSLLGFVGRDGKGLEGLEHRFNSILEAQAGWKISTRTVRGHDLPGGELERHDPTGGASIYLTVDGIIQHLVERELDEIERLYEPKSAFLLVMEPSSGEVLAWGSRPGFDPNTYQTYPRSTWRNRMITDIFEPGSTFKIITAAAALEDRVLDLETRFNCPGFIKLWDHTIGCHGVHGMLTLPDIIAKSCNVGIIKIGQVLGPENFYYYMRKFGFGVKTGVPLAGESNGILRKPRKWSGLSIGALSMGQEIGVTALQVAAAIGAVANGGSLIRPRLVHRIVGKEGEELPLTEELQTVKRTVISPETCDKIIRMMSEVVVRGTGKRGRVDTWQAAGKTGTSQKLGTRRRFGEHEKYVASFIGFLPVRDPKALIYIVVNEPKGSRREIAGGAMAAPSFRRLAPKIMIYRDVPPDDAVMGLRSAPEGEGEGLAVPPTHRAVGPAGTAVRSDTVYIESDPIQDLLAREARRNAGGR
jgi:stage V sporulation protein D (sporulation-specific penicillin-binding protein)